MFILLVPQYFAGVANASDAKNLWAHYKLSQDDAYRNQFNDVWRGDVQFEIYSKNPISKELINGFKWTSLLLKQGLAGCDIDLKLNAAKNSTNRGSIAVVLLRDVADLEDETFLKTELSNAREKLVGMIKNRPNEVSVILNRFKKKNANRITSHVYIYLPSDDGQIDSFYLKRAMMMVMFHFENQSVFLQGKEPTLFSFKNPEKYRSSFTRNRLCEDRSFISAFCRNKNRPNLSYQSYLQQIKTDQNSCKQYYR